jgi:hypothetical protein
MTLGMLALEYYFENLKLKLLSTLYVYSMNSSMPILSMHFQNYYTVISHPLYMT